MREQSWTRGRPQQALVALLCLLCLGLLCKCHGLAEEASVDEHERHEQIVAASRENMQHMRSEQAWSLQSDFTCHDILAYTWTRRVCFEPVVPRECPDGGSCAGEYVIRMTVKKRRGGLAGTDGDTPLDPNDTGIVEDALLSDDSSDEEPSPQGSNVPQALSFQAQPASRAELSDSGSAGSSEWDGFGPSNFQTPETASPAAHQHKRTTWHETDVFDNEPVVTWNLGRRGLKQEETDDHGATPGGGDLDSGGQDVASGQEAGGFGGDDRGDGGQQSVGSSGSMNTSPSDDVARLSTPSDDLYTDEAHPGELSDDWEPTCGDSFRARFFTAHDEIWFASLLVDQGGFFSASASLLSSPQGDGGDDAGGTGGANDDGNRGASGSGGSSSTGGGHCSHRYEIIFQPPMQAAEYRMEMRLLHVDGEGMADPHGIEWGAAVAWQERGYNGQTVYNLRFVANGTLQVRPSSHESTGRHADHHGLGRRRDRGHLDRAPLSSLSPADRHLVLPQCTSGDHRGRWTLADDLRYPPFEGEPFQWLPYDCRYRMYTTDAIRGCLLRKPDMRVYLLGESILHDMYSLLQLHLNGTKERVNDVWSNYYWPRYHSGWDDIDPRPFHNRFRHTMVHGLGILLGALRAAVQEWAHSDEGPPSVLVLLSAHNDMMRRSREEYEANVRTVVTILKDEAQFKGRIIWVIAPIRLYKLPGVPGECRCPGGKSDECGLVHAQKHCWCACSDVGEWLRERVMLDEHPGNHAQPKHEKILFTEFASGFAVRELRVQEEPHDASRISFEGEWLYPLESDFRHYQSRGMPLVHNTFERVVWANQKAVQILKEAFPGTSCGCLLVYDKRWRMYSSNRVVMQ
eukprot:jgi/Mesvir1/389/Mv11281-RA.1